MPAQIAVALCIYCGAQKKGKIIDSSKRNHVLEDL